MPVSALPSMDLYAKSALDRDEAARPGLQNATDQQKTSAVSDEKGKTFPAALLAAFWAFEPAFEPPAPMSEPKPDAYTPSATQSTHCT